jgi:hypothetical protein
MRRRGRIAVAATAVLASSVAAALGSCKGETFEGGAIDAGGDAGDGGAGDATPPSDGGSSDAEYPFFSGSSTRGEGCGARAVPEGGVCVDFDDGGSAVSFFDNLEGTIQPSLDDVRSTSKPNSVAFAAISQAASGGITFGGERLGKRSSRDAYLAFDYELPSATAGYVEIAAIRWTTPGDGNYAVTLVSVTSAPMRLEETWSGQDGGVPMTTVSIDRAYVAAKFHRVELAVVTSEPSARRAVLRVDGNEVGRLRLSNQLNALGNDTRTRFVLSPYAILDAGTNVTSQYDDFVFFAQ